MKNLGILITVLFIFVGCAGTQNIMVSSAARSYQAKSAHLVTQGGNSHDMDSYLQRELLARKFNVSASSSENKTPPPDLVVKYTDNWSWDLAMYLNRLDITLLDRNGNILATGSYQNTFWHEWPDAGETVKSLLDQIFEQMPSPLANKKP